MTSDELTDAATLATPSNSQAGEGLTVGRETMQDRAIALAGALQFDRSGTSTNTGSVPKAGSLRANKLRFVLCYAAALVTAYLVGALVVITAIKHVH